MRPRRFDYLQSMNNNSKHCWVAGFSSGHWIGMQLLMAPSRRLLGFILGRAPAQYIRLFVFWRRCLHPGLVINAQPIASPPADTHQSWSAKLL